MRKMLIIVVMLGTGLVAHVRADLSDGLVAYWPFDGSYIDLTGNGNTCTPVGTPTFGAGVLDTAVQIDGDNNIYLTLPLVLPRVAGTISTWVRSNDAANDRQIIYYESDGNYDGWSGNNLLEIHTALRTPGRVYTCYQDGEGNNDTPNSERKWHSPNDTIVLDEWNHIVMTWEQRTDPLGNKITYINGVEENSQTLRPPTTKVADRHFIGIAPNSGDRGLDGWVDDVAVWDRVLSPEEITELYNDGNGKNPLTFVASNISPVDGTVDTPRQRGASLDTELEWGPPVPASSILNPTYVAVIGLVDPNANPGDPSIQRIDVGTATKAKPPIDLLPDKTYYWLVEVTGTDSNGISTTVNSDLWNFQTESEGPYILSDPTVQVVDAGDDAVFVVTVSAIQPETYQWYKVDPAGDIEIVGATTNTLTISGADKSDNGAYYCKVTNVVREAITDSANLAIKELWAHYRFENDTLDETGLGHHAELRVNDPNTADAVVPPPATFVTGIVGNGLLFNGVDQWAYIGTENPSELSGQVSASAWVLWNGFKVDDPWQNLISKRSANDFTQAMWQIQIHPNLLGRTRFNVAGGSNISGPPVPGPEGIERTEDGTATASAEDIEAGQGVANFFDNDEGSESKWQTGPNYGPAENAVGWAIYDFKGEDAYAITSYAVTAANNNAVRDPNSWTLEGSNDGETWDVLDSQENMQGVFARNETRSFVIAAPAEYKMYKFNVSSNSGHANRMQIAELQLFEAVSVDQLWAHVAATFDGQTAVLYVNGVEVARDEDFALGTGFSANFGLAVGNMNDEYVGNPGDIPSLPWATGLLNGALDEVRVHNYALGRYEVAQIVANDSAQAVCPEYHPYDTDKNCVVDLPDLAALLLDWAVCDIVPDCIP